MPAGRNNIPPGGLPSRPRTWRSARKVDVEYIKELEAELVLARSIAKSMQVQRDEARNRNTKEKD